ncbi:DNA primase domain protein [Yersinia pestis PY-13]|nr:DNA primase domain protein [Yersinia pestis PY-01]EIQ94240.1 DNA primase domain protein [Yersinia pestis PY-02]EIQ96545.1 DNA primase domain protein [Yersinia pestis PY-03]EIR07613.1 DNA primase domain protein [Yersinia pestis PY-04]EIR08521.1 DNA primase domain protein [Yersinia pestis PY-05]EIR10911.1 DNA primase domain protein [Yersinia pestis PY-06]EIR22363.1 DNA primase domain protein [Yersinia pestis PY-07]EIR25513.1 DNA primase domain protein [Yersinia pestis PY-09]EIR37413.1 DNA 
MRAVRSIMRKHPHSLLTAKNSFITVLAAALMAMLLIF